MSEQPNHFIIFLVVIAVIVAVVFTTRFFAKHRIKKRNLSRKWANDSNYNIAADAAELEAIEEATPAEARELLKKIKDGKAPPVSEELFYALKKKL